MTTDELTEELGRFAEPALLVLVSLASGPKHGYAMMADIAVASDRATFRVPDDPGPSPWPIPGSARLALELVLLGVGALGWVLAGWAIAGLLVGALIVGHYLMTADRVRWLLERH